MEQREIACSSCFSDFGLRETAKKYGTSANSACPNCGTLNGKKLNRDGLDAVCNEYFVIGSTRTGWGNFAPVLQVNDVRDDAEPIGTPILNVDIEMLSQLGPKCFLYGPPLWRFGKPANEDGNVEWSDEDFAYIMQNCPEVWVSTKTQIFRTQLDVADDNMKPERFCSPPQEFRKSFGRFDSEELPIWYGAFDVETCLHESRVTLQHHVFVAVCSPAKPLRILDLSNCELSDVSPFDDPEIWLLALIYAGKESYAVCRRLAAAIALKGYDGFIYTSFFQQAAERKHLNIALFGRPIIDGKVYVNSFDTVRLRNVSYDWQFGPVVIDTYSSIVDEFSSHHTNAI